MSNYGNENKIYPVYCTYRGKKERGFESTGGKV